MPAVSWQDQARCHQYDPELFFDPHRRSERRAKSICERCPVRAECLLFAFEAHAEFGVWGGLNSKERRKVARLSPKTSDWRPVLEAAGLIAS